MTAPQSDKLWQRNAVILVAVSLILFLVLTVMFLDLIQSHPVEGGDAIPPAAPRLEAPSASRPEGGAQGEDRSGTSDAVRGRTDVVEGPAPDFPGRRDTAGPAATTNGMGADRPIADTYAVYTDTAHGFRINVPADWRTATLDAGGSDPSRPDYDVIFEEPEMGARLSVSAWDGRERAPFVEWVEEAVGGMRTPDGDLEPNARLGGVPAIVVVRQEWPVVPAMAAAVLQYGEWYYRVAWSPGPSSIADDGDGPSAATFMRALASFGWSDGGTGSSSAANTAPRLDLVPARYFPSDRLFRSQQPSE